MNATITLHRSPSAGFDQPFEMLAACHERVQRMLALMTKLAAHLPAHGADEQARSAARDVMREARNAGAATACMIDLETLARRGVVIHDQLDAMDALEGLRAAEVPMLLVHDEYGHFDGLVTPADLLSAIAGEFASDQDIGSEPFVVERDDGYADRGGSRTRGGNFPPAPGPAHRGAQLPDDARRD